MPSTTWTREEFALMDHDGQPVAGSLVSVALDITYHRDGEWQIDTAGFIIRWGNRYYIPAEIAWLPERNALEQLIIDRAESVYADEIGEHIAECVGEDRNGVDDAAYERLRELQMGD